MAIDTDSSLSMGRNVFFAYGITTDTHHPLLFVAVPAYPVPWLFEHTAREIREPPILSTLERILGLRVCGRSKNRTLKQLPADSPLAPNTHLLGSLFHSTGLEDKTGKSTNLKCFQVV